MVFRLTSEVKNYDWGKRSAISNFLGHESNGTSEAEIWWGNHQMANCIIKTQDGDREFPGWLSETGLSFNFLVKLLAVGKTLSIQVHPDQAQAEEGFRVENLSGVPLTEPSRKFRDASSKPELLISLSKVFVGVAGFLSKNSFSERLRRWSEAGAPESLRLFLASAARDLPAAFYALKERDYSSREAEALAELVIWLDQVSETNFSDTTAKEIHLMRKVCTDHPRDPAALLVSTMHHIYLKRGEALFVPEREVHAYVEGFGLEIMLPSDNVSRIGLTSKHLSPDLFVSLANFETRPGPQVLKGAELPSGKSYQPDEAEFMVLHLISQTQNVSPHSPAICLVETGSVDVLEDASVSHLPAGTVAFLAPGASLAVSESGTSAWIIQSKSA